MAGDGQHVTRTAPPSFSSQTSTLYAWDEAYFLNLQDSLSLQIVLEGLSLGSENDSGSSARHQLVQWANGSLEQAKQIDIPRGYTKDGRGSPLAVGSVDFISGSKAGRSREAELLNLQTGKSVGTVTLFLLPVTEEDLPVEHISASTQDRSEVADPEAVESIPPATRKRVHEVFEEFTKEAMQSAPFEDMEENLDIMDTTDSYMSGQREDEVVERRYFYVLEDRPLIKERTTRFLEKIWVEKEYVRQLHLVEERQLPGHTEVLDSKLYISTPSHKTKHDTLRAAQDVLVEEEKVPQQADNGRLQGSFGNCQQQSSDNGLQQSSEHHTTAAEPARSADAKANAPTAHNAASTLSSKGQSGVGKSEKDTKDESVAFAHCSAGLSWLKRRLPGNKRSRSHDADQPALGADQAADGGCENIPADPSARKTQTETRSDLRVGQGGEQLPSSYQAGQSNGALVSKHTDGGVPTTHKANQSSRQAGSSTGSGSSITRLAGTQVDTGDTQSGLRAQMGNGSQTGMGSQKGNGVSAQKGNGSQKVATRSMAYDPDQLPVAPQQRQGGGQPGALDGVDGVVADMQATMQGAMADVLGQQGGMPQSIQTANDSLVERPGATSWNGLASQPGTVTNGDSLARRVPSPSIESSHFTIVEERRILKERVERFVEHRIFECEYVFEVRYKGERALKSRQPTELIKRELRVLG